MSAATEQEDSVSDFQLSLHFLLFLFYYPTSSYLWAIATANCLFKDKFHPDIRNKLFR